jgi:hypothetical protein
MSAPLVIAGLVRAFFELIKISLTAQDGIGSWWIVVIDF